MGRGRAAVGDTGTLAAAAWAAAQPGTGKAGDGRGPAASPIWTGARKSPAGLLREEQSADAPGTAVCRRCRESL